MWVCPQPLGAAKIPLTKNVGGQVSWWKRFRHDKTMFILPSEATIPGNDIKMPRHSLRMAIRDECPVKNYLSREKGEEF